jgi:hypothetical protein
MIKTALVVIKFIYSEKATKFCEISTLILSYVVRKVVIEEWLAVSSS